MDLSRNTYKALIATFLFCSVVVVLGFTMHIKKKSELVAETFYELQPEDIKEEEKEEIEALDDVLESIDNLLRNTTNQAYNETRKYESIDEKTFNERLEEIQNRNNEPTQNPSETDSNSNPTTTSDTEENSTYNDIKNLISEKRETTKTGDNTVNKNSSISYSLVDRTKIDIPPPIYLCEKGGKIVINITVNSSGDVTEAYFNNASTSKDGCMVDHALEYAKAAKFNTDASKLSQLGSITFYFKGK